MKMKLSEFKARVKELAGGRYHSVRVSVAEHSDGTIIYEWSAYIDGGTVIKSIMPDAVLSTLRGEPSSGEAPDDEELPT
jgi:hypothetical protein